MNFPNKKDIEKIIYNSSETTYLTHNFHPFPAKFIPQIPKLMINWFTLKGETVFDPYCGSGTTLVESKLLGRNSLGIDVHPLGVFISKVKTTKIPSDELKKTQRLLDSLNVRLNNLNNENESIISFLEKKPMPCSEDRIINYLIPDFPNRDHWFEKTVLHELSVIYDSIIKAEASKDLKDLWLLAFSSIIVSVSNQDSETRYAAISKKIPFKHPFKLFKEKSLHMSERLCHFNDLASNCNVIIHNADSRKLDFLDENIADFIVTSPPYANTYDYYLYHKHRMNWLKMNWEFAKNNEIGSRLRHSSQGESIDYYINDMAKCFEHFNRILKPGKLFVIVIGDSIVEKTLQESDEIVSSIAAKSGFKIEDKIAYNLGYASKLFNPAFRNKAKQEHIILLKNQK
jgi:DNA modification methylase